MIFIENGPLDFEPINTDRSDTQASIIFHIYSSTYLGQDRRLNYKISTIQSIS